MGPIEAVRTCFAKSFVWRGRASLAEFWWFAFATALVGFVDNLLLEVVLEATDSLGAGLIVYFPLWLVLFFPGLAVTIRRLHDTNHNGGWFWIWLVPFIGAIVLLVFMVTPSTPGPNRYGPNPIGTPPPPRHALATSPGAPPGAAREAGPGAGPEAAPAVTAVRPPSTPGVHWCATPGCPMYQTNVGQDTCYSCGNPTQETEPR